MLGSPNGTSRHFTALQQFGRFRSNADIGPRSRSRIYEYTALGRSRRVFEARGRRARPPASRLAHLREEDDPASVCEKFHYRSSLKRAVDHFRAGLHRLRGHRLHLGFELLNSTTAPLLISPATEV